MGVLKRKTGKRSDHVQLPAALKRGDRALRSRAEDAGFDLGETNYGCDVAALQTDQGRARRCASSGPES